MFNGDQFGDAVKNARSYIYDKYPNNNTWGAYQCYGDPFFRLESGSKVKQAPKYIVPEEAEIDLDNLLNMLEMGRTNDELVMDQLTEIENAIEETEDILKTAQVTERIARIYQQLGLYEKAVERYGALLLMEKANFTYSSMEQYCNLQVKLYVKEGLTRPKEINDYYKKNLEVIEYLNVLKQSGNTAERNNLLGSAYKRCSMLAPDKSKRIKAYQGSYIYYQSAMKQSGNWNDVYSLTNAIILERLLVLYGARSSSVVKFDNHEFKIRTNGSAKSASPIGAHEDRKHRKGDGVRYDQNDEEGRHVPGPRLSGPVGERLPSRPYPSGNGGSGFRSPAHDRYHRGPFGARPPGPTRSGARP
jgi:tetratricopeptide (TPR) repeat protein